MMKLDFDPHQLTTFASHLAQTPPDHLYHYTGQAGLKGIIEEAELRATKAQYMNDSTEFAGGLNLAEIIIESEINNSSNGKRERLSELFQRRAGIANANLFVACFCETADLLSQWRGYSGGSYGYSLTMSSGKLSAHAKMSEFVLAKCIYEEADQIQIIDQLITHCLEIEEKMEMQVEFERGLLLVSAFFKDDSFREEHEWRIVSKVKSILDKQVGFREGKSMLVPFFRVPIGQAADSAIEGVTVGPCPHAELSQASAHMLLRRYGLVKDGRISGVEWPNVHLSKVPYRNW